MVEGLSIIAGAKSESCGTGLCPLRSVMERVSNSTSLQDACSIAENNGLTRSTNVTDSVLKIILDRLPAAQFECHAKDNAQGNTPCGQVMFIDRSYYQGE
jgi:hypothetical protein